jgi:hypothetical protein
MRASFFGGVIFGGGILFVIPAKAGIQSRGNKGPILKTLDPGFRRDDNNNLTVLQLLVDA